MAVGSRFGPLANVCAPLAGWVLATRCRWGILLVSYAAQLPILAAFFATVLQLNAILDPQRLKSYNADSFSILLAAQAWAAEVCVSKKGELLTTDYVVQPIDAPDKSPALLRALAAQYAGTSAGRGLLDARTPGSLGAEPALVRVPPDGLGAVRGDDLAQMSQLLEDALSRDGVAVTRAACPEAAGAACAACLAAGLDGLERKLALPQTMAERMRGPSLRHFVPICTTASAAREARRAASLMPFAPCFAAALRAALAGEAGAILVAALGRDAELRELQVIVSEPGAAAQDVHSDSNWGAPRLVTMFIGAPRRPGRADGPDALLAQHARAALLPGRGLAPTNGVTGRKSEIRLVRAPCGRRGAHGRLHVAPRRRQHVGDPTTLAFHCSPRRLLLDRRRRDCGVRRMVLTR